MAKRIEIKISLTREQLHLLSNDVKGEREEYQKLCNKIGNKLHSDVTDEEQRHYDFYKKEITKRKELEAILGAAFRQYIIQGGE